MGWVTLSLRRSELQASISDHQLQLLQISRQLRKLANFSNAVGDGKINPNEIASIGTEFFGDGLDFMGYSNEAAMEVAQIQTDEYGYLYENLTMDEYYNNPNAANGAELYYNPETGALDRDRMYQEFYEEALEQYANEVVLPRLNELEKDLENKKAGIETQLESEKAELESVKQSVSESIQSSTIKL